MKGLWTTPANGSPSFIRATDIPISGIPLEKLAVPSIGSTIHVYPFRRTFASSPSSPLNAEPGMSAVSSLLRKRSFSTSIDVTRFSLVPFTLTEKSLAPPTATPDRLTTSAICDSTTVRTTAIL